MILVDTNVISEALRQAPEARVVAWIDAQPIETLFLSAITVAELRYGIAALPSGRRQSRLDEDVETRLLPLFTGRVLPFDLAAAKSYAGLMARARSAGAPIGTADGYIAATAAANVMAVASRDTAPFLAAGLKVVDPWKT